MDVISSWFLIVKGSLFTCFLICDCCQYFIVIILSNFVYFLLLYSWPAERDGMLDKWIQLWLAGQSSVNIVGYACDTSHNDMSR